MPRYLPLIVILTGGIGLVCYFSWLPNPNLRGYGFLPDWLAYWTDAAENINLRTAVPFFLLGLLSGFWLLMTKQAWAGWVVIWVLLVSIVGLAEIGQLRLPHRHFDWADIMWGSVGAFGGLGLCAPFALRYHKERGA